MHRIEVDGIVRRFSLDLESIYQAELKHGVRIGWADLSPMSFGAMVKFAWAGFMAENPDLDRATAISWLQKCDREQLSRAILDDMKASGMIGDNKADEASEDDPLSSETGSTGTGADLSALAS